MSRTKPVFPDVGRPAQWNSLRTVAERMHWHVLRLSPIRFSEPSPSLHVSTASSQSCRTPESSKPCEHAHLSSRRCAPSGSGGCPKDVLDSFQDWLDVILMVAERVLTRGDSVPEWRIAWEQTRSYNVPAHRLVSLDQGHVTPHGCQRRQTAMNPTASTSN